MVEIRTMAGFLRPDALLGAADVVLDRTIRDRRPLAEVRYGLYEGEATLGLVVSMEKVPYLHAAAESPFFGLWHYDCGELFISAENGRYLEFNLAPNGVWWSGAFAAPRQPDPTVAAPALQTVARVEPHRWEAALTVSTADVARALQSEGPWRANVTAIVGGYPDENPDPDALMSLAKIDTEAPDFHVPGRFLSLARS